MEDAALLPVLPWTAAALGVVLLVGLQVPVPAHRRAPLPSGPSPVASRTGSLLLGLLLVALLLAARLGPPGELDNPVPALVLGLGLPLLLVLAPLLTALLRVLLAPLLPRRAGRPTGTDSDTDIPPATATEPDVRPALPLALLLAGLLVLVPERGRPDVLGAALAGYGVLVLAAGVAGGRRLAGRCEVLGLLARWAALGPRLTAWSAPRGAVGVLVLLLGAAWAERFSRTTAWSTQAPGRGALALLLAVAVAVAAVVALGLRRAGAAPVLLPLLAGALVAGATRRVLVSAQLLAAQAGTGPRALQADPLGLAGGQGLALGLAAAGGVCAAVVVARRSGPGADRLSGLAAVLAATAVTAVVVLQP